MNHIKEFEEYLKKGIAKRQAPDINRAKALLDESDESYHILKEDITKNGVSDRNANHLIKNAYDIIMELIRARMLEAGFGTSGEGAHAAEVSFLRNLGYSEQEIEFADKIRYFRNGILYYGKKLDKEYAEKVILFLEKVRKKLRNGKK